LGFAIEPDRRYGGATVAADAEVVLFRAEGGAPVDPDRPAFVAAKAAIEVATLAALADGALTPDEFAALLARAQAMRHVEPAEKLRLEAMVWALRGQARIGATLKRAAALPEGSRRGIAAAAVATVLANGQASPREVAFLERVHRTLGLPVEAVHAALHQGAIGDMTATPGTSPGGQGIALDAQRLQRIREETSTVSALLSGIFADDEPEAAAALPVLRAADTEPSPFEGLDRAHGKLLKLVAAAGRMDAVAFTREAQALRLLPDGAAETINDWGFDRFGEALLDTDGDRVAIADHLVRELSAAEWVR